MVPASQLAHSVRPSEPAYWPSEHGLQTDSPSVAEMVPARQSVHADAPLFAEMVPAVQSAQPVARSPEKVPAVQSVHTDAPPAENAPAVHPWHTVSPCTGPYRPAAQGSHDPWPGPEKVPSRHGSHADSPVEFANEPASQGEQAVASDALLKVPAGQSVHRGAAPVLKLPGVHEEQVCVALNCAKKPGAHATQGLSTPEAKSPPVGLS
mmetsp:Transcript_35979/g.83872  ORF Transcript_35979/g.83872 Transcript_35979/m.83872 type:complete len:208 (-) Transcript_35979:2415-3038(-)